MGAVFSAIDSAFEEAIVFGVISPKRRIKIVMIPVDIPITAESNNWAKTTVASDAAAIFTKLCPMRIVMINLWGFSLIFARVSAPFFFCFSRDFILILLRETRAVSIPEKNPERTKNSINNSIWFCNMLSFVEVFESIKSL